MQQDEDLQGEGLRHVGLVLAVRGGHDLGDVVLVRKEVDDVQEASEIAVLEGLADGDEEDGDAGGNADGVLDVEVLYRGSANALERREK